MDFFLHWWSSHYFILFNKKNTLGISVSLLPCIFMLVWLTNTLFYTVLMNFNQYWNLDPFSEEHPPYVDKYVTICLSITEDFGNEILVSPKFSIESHFLWDQFSLWHFCSYSHLLHTSHFLMNWVQRRESMWLPLLWNPLYTFSLSCFIQLFLRRISSSHA